MGDIPSMRNVSPGADISRECVRQLPEGTSLLMMWALLRQARRWGIGQVLCDGGGPLRHSAGHTVGKGQRPAGTGCGAGAPNGVP
jgi:hypothetical protein